MNTNGGFKSQNFTTGLLRPLNPILGVLRGPHRFWISAYHVDIGFNALWPWTHFKVHRPSYSRPKQGFYRHIVWGRFSLLIDQPQIETVTVCSHCLEEIQGISAGDESWSYCESCQQVEGDTIEITELEYEQGILK